jgi:Meiotically up-regulated gene 113/Helix-turn-helix domain
MSAGWMYAVREDGTPLVKVGCTMHLAARVKALQKAYRSPRTLIASVFVQHRYYQVERRLHQRLAAAHIQGEWFYLHMTQEVLERLTAQAVHDTMIFWKIEQNLRGIGASLRRARKRQGLPVQRVLGTAQVSRAPLSHIELGHNGPVSAEAVQRVAGVLGISREDLLAMCP